MIDRWLAWWRLARLRDMVLLAAGWCRGVVVSWFPRRLSPLYLIAPSFNTIPGVGVAFDGDALTAVAV
jgi:hypothetical protein